MKRPILPILLFVGFTLAAALTGYGSYQRTEQMVQADLNQALRKMIGSRKGPIVSADTIRAYRLLSAQAGEAVAVSVADPRLRQFLNDKRLRKKTYISYTLAHPTTNERLLADSGMVQSDTFHVRINQDEVFAVKSYAQLSASLIFSLSDQRMSLLFSLLACLSMLFPIAKVRRRQPSGLAWIPTSPAAATTTETGTPSWGGLRYNAASGRFERDGEGPVRFTPMQQQLMEMFYRAPEHRLSQKEICEALWPKKDNPQETLYTLVRRLKQVLAQSSSLRIEVDRSHGYEIAEVLPNKQNH